MKVSVDMSIAFVSTAKVNVSVQTSTTLTLYNMSFYFNRCLWFKWVFAKIILEPKVWLDPIQTCYLIDMNFLGLSISNWLNTDDILLRNRSLYVLNLGDSCLKFFCFILYCSIPEKWLIFFVCMAHFLCMHYGTWSCSSVFEEINETCILFGTILIGSLHITGWIGDYGKGIRTKRRLLWNDRSYEKQSNWRGNCWRTTFIVWSTA